MGIFHFLQMSSKHLNFEINKLIKLAAVFSIIFLIYSLITMALVFTIGSYPETPEEIFALLSENPIIGLLRMDILTILIIPSYLIIFYGIYLSFKRDPNKSHSINLFLYLLVCCGIGLFLSSVKLFNYITLFAEYNSTSDLSVRNQLLIICKSYLFDDMWTSSSALIGGLLLQGVAVVYSIQMLSSNQFSKITGWIGIIMHGIDFLHIIALIFSPKLGEIMLIFSGILYLVWFPLLARDLFRITKKS